MSERFRELETSQQLRKKDVVLLATVTSFEGLTMPGKTELRQFSDLFAPLYQNSSEEARRLAVAALSQCARLPATVACFIANQPIDIAAPFLIASPALSDDMLISIARTQGSAHARAIAARADLSVEVVDALVSLRQDIKESLDPEPGKADTAAVIAMPDRRESERLAAEELLRHELKFRVMREAPGLAEDSGEIATRDALLVRFARERQARDFAIVLADAMGASLWLAERIMLDLSGEQLGTTLNALGLDPADSAFVLGRLYPHLDKKHDGISRGRALIDGLEPQACRARLDAWVRADDYTTGAPGKRDADAANRNHVAVEGRNVAALLRPAVQDGSRPQTGPADDRKMRAKA